MLLKLFVSYWLVLIVQGTFIDSKENLRDLIYQLSEFHSTKQFTVILDTNGEINNYEQQKNPISLNAYHDLRSSFANTLFMISNNLDLVTLNTVVVYLNLNLHFESDTVKQLIEYSTLGAVYVISPNLTSVPSEFTHHNIPFLSRLNFLIQNQSGTATFVEAFNVSPKDKILHTQQFGTLDNKTGIWNFHRVGRNNFYGVALRFVIKQEKIPMEVEDLKLFVESYFEFWNIISHTLNYTYKVDTIAIRPEEEDRIYPGTLSLVRDGKADLSLDNYVPTPANVEKLAYLKPSVSEWTAIFTKKPEFRCTVWSFITVFTVDVWVSILATWLILSGAYYIHILLTEDSHCPGDCFLIVLGTLTGKGLTRASDHLSTRILLITTLICGYLINNFFVFLLLGKLTYKTPSLPFETLDDLIDLQPEYPINVHISRPIVASSQAVTSGPLFVIGRLLNQNPRNVHRDAQSMIDRVCKENAVLLESTSKFFSYENHVTQCKLVRSKKVYFPNYLYIATRKDFPYRENMDSVASKTREFGIFSRNGLRLMRIKGVFEDEEPITTVIDMEMVFPIFCAYGLLVIFSLLIFAIELCIYRRGLKY